MSKVRISISVSAVDRKGQWTGRVSGQEGAVWTGRVSGQEGTVDRKGQCVQEEAVDRKDPGGGGEPH